MSIVVGLFLDFSKDFGYVASDKYDDLMNRYDEVNRMLYEMIDKPDKFCKYYCLVLSPYFYKKGGVRR